jgi:hypothetical protein
MKDGTHLTIIKIFIKAIIILNTHGTQKKKKKLFRDVFE